MIEYATKGDGSEAIEKITYTYTTRILGKGLTGHIFEAKLAETGEIVAVKKNDYRRHGRIKEVEYLKKLKHCNIINMMYYFWADPDLEHVEYIIMERMPGSLYLVYNQELRLRDFDIKLYMYQLLRSLAFIHAQGVCHRDIKPDNILIDPHNGVLKLCDFGLAEDLSLSPRHSPLVCTISHRAPELLVGYRKYTNSIDTWSAGCIFVELLNGGEMLFNGDAEPSEKLEEIIDVLGTPPEEFMDMQPSYPFDELPQKEAKSWSDIVSPFPISEEAVSLCSGLFCYLPSSRISPHRALAHTFFDELRLPESKFLANGNPLPPLFNFQPGEFPDGFEHLIPSYMNKKTGKDNGRTE